MAWTVPKTWTSGEVVSAANMNTHVRDNLQETAPAKAATVGEKLWVAAANSIVVLEPDIYKAADETVNNSGTLQDDDHFSFQIAANEKWAFRLVLLLRNGSGTPGFKSAFTVPAGCTGFYTLRGVLQASETGSPLVDQAWTWDDITAAPGGGFGGGASYTHGQFLLDGTISNGANAGTVQLQWAQVSAVASDTTVKAGSYLSLWRIE